jgi:hypothetical protein
MPAQGGTASAEAYNSRPEHFARAPTVFIALGFCVYFSAWVTGIAALASQLSGRGWLPWTVARRVMLAVAIEYTWELVLVLCFRVSVFPKWPLRECLAHHVPFLAYIFACAAFLNRPGWETGNWTVFAAALMQGNEMLEVAQTLGIDRALGCAGAAASDASAAGGGGPARPLPLFERLRTHWAVCGLGNCIVGEAHDIAMCWWAPLRGLAPPSMALYGFGFCPMLALHVKLWGKFARRSHRILSGGAGSPASRKKGANKTQ